jgi:cytoskeletal protein RodZ
MALYTEKQIELVTEIGRRLKASRQAQGLSIQDIATRTRIHAAYLEKIEAGQLDGLPSLPFVRGFLRNYLEALDLDDPALLEAVGALGQQQNIAPPAPMKATTIKLLDMEKEVTNWGRWVLVGLLGLLVLWVGYLVVRVATAPREPAPTASEAPVQSIPPVGESVLGGTPAPAPAPAAAAAETGAAAARPPEPRSNLRLTVRGLEETWLRLALDRQPAVDVQIRPADTLTFDANDEIRLTVGRSHAVSLYLNGEEVGLPQGKNRLVSDLVLNKLNLLKMQN